MVCNKCGRRAKGDRSKKAKIWQSFIPTMIWNIWLSRNQVVFKGSSVALDDSFEKFIKV
ncbi:hypothetical protein QJS04_geneDACA022774 [Acorus gramineus]|uniref:Uncharacterized protein n=1 Tax=Acorus gramineus TaxID=55184 RepID=A0AAV9AZD9_ACOGR|nr:hypothetical protein QJS04_geneDACA022774 [Acorus gramineus]